MHIYMIHDYHACAYLSRMLVDIVHGHDGDMDAYVSRLRQALRSELEGEPRPIFKSRHQPHNRPNPSQWPSEYVTNPDFPLLKLP